MNPTPITGSVNEKGLFTAKNPYSDMPCKHENTSGYCRENENCRCDNYDKYTSEHPQLLTYTPSNVLVTDEEHVEVKEAWRYFDFDMNTWVNVNVVPSVGYKRFSELYRKTDRVYITIPPTEKAVDQYYDVFNQAWMDNGEGIENWKEQGFQTRTITEAQPLEGVKTAEETYPELKERLSKITDPIEREAEEFASLNFSDGTGDSPYVAGYEGVLHGIQWQKEQSKSAQFATDAGGCKRVDADKVMRTYFNIDNYTQEGLDRFTAYSQDVLRAINLAISQVSAHSNNSSSEMVEVEKVVSLVSNFYKGSSCYSEMLITQIRTKK